MTEQITVRQFDAAGGVDDLRVLYHVASARFAADSLASGAALAAEIARIAGTAGPYVDIDLRHAGVTVTLKTRDIALARQISAAARARGLAADPTDVQHVHVTIDALAPAAVLPFWRSVLGYRNIGDDFLLDPAGRGPCLEFQQMDAPRPQRSRLHIDIAVPHDQAAALAAGGHLVSDARAPMWRVLADPEGNEACVATWLGRD